MAEKPRKPSPHQPSESTRALAAGLTFGVVVALFAVGGTWLDRQLTTSPLFVLLGVGLGLVGGTIHLLAAISPGALPFGRKQQPPGAGRPTGSRPDSRLDPPVADVQTGSPADDADDADARRSAPPPTDSKPTHRDPDTT